MKGEFETVRFLSDKMSDLDKYKEKVNQVEDSSLDSTARTLALLNEVGV